MRVRLLGVPRCRFWSLRHWCCLLLGITSQLSCFPPCPLSALLRSLCTPANTRLITPLSIGPRFTPKGREVLSSLCCLSISFPHIGLYNLLSILFFSLQANLKPWRLYVLDIVVTCCTLIKLSMLDVPVFTLKPVCFGVLFITHSFMEVHSRHVWKCAWAHRMTGTLAPAQMFVLVVKSRIGEKLAAYLSQRCEGYCFKDSRVLLFLFFLFYHWGKKDTTPNLFINRLICFILCLFSKEHSFIKTQLPFLWGGG